MLTAFDPKDTLTNLKVHMTFILRPGLMYCQVRSCLRWKGVNAKSGSKSVQKHLSLKTHTT